MSVQKVFNGLNVSLVTGKAHAPLRCYRVDTVPGHLRIAIAKLCLSGTKICINLRGNLGHQLKVSTAMVKLP